MLRTNYIAVGYLVSLLLVSCGQIESKTTLAATTSGERSLNYKLKPCGELTRVRTIEPRGSGLVEKSVIRFKSRELIREMTLIPLTSQARQALNSIQVKASGCVGTNTPPKADNLWVEEVTLN